MDLAFLCYILLIIHSYCFVDMAIPVHEDPVNGGSHWVSLSNESLHG